ncbi:hypothetical protein [Phorcysia thermohydrogeniphila]|uniref:Uncharacterized protein n=1 Tax=Phorcysia thermohydrogeniphila TaxID=936138 RepID=A0A4R1GCG6_9BACT|nr:hypothetical protein [Phorcysia thermohydrogeniphila]TCK04463.1 hypothetical protein CLV27_0888 [Phorcysia thermohydrogeniphila]
MKKVSKTSKEDVIRINEFGIMEIKRLKLKLSYNRKRFRLTIVLSELGSHRFERKPDIAQGAIHKSAPSCTFTSKERYK